MASIIIPSYVEEQSLTIRRAKFGGQAVYDVTEFLVRVGLAKVHSEARLGEAEGWVIAEALGKPTAPVGRVDGAPGRRPALGLFLIRPQLVLAEHLEELLTVQLGEIPT